MTAGGVLAATAVVWLRVIALFLVIQLTGLALVPRVDAAVDAVRRMIAPGARPSAASYVI